MLLIKAFAWIAVAAVAASAASIHVDVGNYPQVVFVEEEAHQAPPSTRLPVSDLGSEVRGQPPKSASEASVNALKKDGEPARRVEDQVVESTQTHTNKMLRANAQYGPVQGSPSKGVVFGKEKNEVNIIAAKKDRLPDCLDSVKFSMCVNILRYWRCGKFTPGGDSTEFDEGNKSKDVCANLKAVAPDMSGNCEAVRTAILQHFQSEAKVKLKQIEQIGGQSSALGDGDELQDRRKQLEDLNSFDKPQREAIMQTCKLVDGQASTVVFQGQCPDEVLCLNYMRKLHVPEFSCNVENVEVRPCNSVGSATDSGESPSGGGQ